MITSIRFAVLILVAMIVLGTGGPVAAFVQLMAGKIMTH
jgi:hypothetical protein